MNKKNVAKAICAALIFLMMLPLFYYIGRLNQKMPGDPIQKLVPDEDHIIGVVLITNDECQEELLSYTENRICEFHTDEVNSIATLSEWLHRKDNIYAIISDGGRHNPNMYVLCNGSETMEDYKQDFVSDTIICKRAANENGTEKEIEIHPVQEGHIWLVYTRKDEPGSYYLYDQQLIYTETNSWKTEQTYYGKYRNKTYEHHISIVVG